MFIISTTKRRLLLRILLPAGIYPQNNHGQVVYLTKEEGNRLTKLTAVAFRLIISGFLVGRYFVGKDEVGLRRTPKPWEIKRF